MGAFKHKHLMLRHLGLANKVIIIDECHAYDAYMSVYLERILEWLGKYQIPTIVLSATLPCGKRASLVNAYTNQKLPAVKNNSDAMFFDIEEEEDVATPEWMTTRAYPLITYSDGEEIRSEMIPREETRREVKICRIDDEALQNSIAQLLADGGCAGIIVNSVARAQTLYRALRERFGTNNVLLFHSRFVMPDRATIEKEVTRLLGKPGKQTQRPTFKIVIGTQVLEQSLDIDFDVLYTDIAPMDLLIQRMGRLHRHTRTRPRHLASPVCYVMGIYENNTFHRAAIAVYGNYLLMRTLALLPETIVLPDNISQLVDDVYNENCEIDGMPQERYAEAKKQYLKIRQSKEGRATAFRLGKPNTSKRSSLNGWLDRDGGEAEERAAVRDIQESIEVILVQELEDGYIHLLDEMQTIISRNEIPNDDQAREILQYSLELPIGVIRHFDDTIAILEKCSAPLAAWLKSRWLKGSLILILDKAGQFNGLPGFVLQYSKTEGLSYQKEQTNA
ncbi:MAG: CRISPR-associated helicase Cas3', partial [Proteobacteria bacterium]|nr:CRISPR-associated helicase Cas3' [Pseudomonadota bacterium]